MRLFKRERSGKLPLQKPPSPPSPGPKVRCRKCGRLMEVRGDLLSGGIKLKCDACGASISLGKKG